MRNTSGPNAVERAKYFHITGVFFGENLRAVRIEGKRVAEGESFDYADGKITRVGDEGEFKLEAVTPAYVSIRHRDGEEVRRKTNLRSQETPPPPSSAAASPSPADSASAESSSPSPAASSSPSAP